MCFRNCSQASRDENRSVKWGCHAMTVSGLTMHRADRHSSQALQNQAQRNRSNRLSCGLFTERCSTPSWWWRAMISSHNAARVRKTDSMTASNADNTAVGGNWRKMCNPHCISQIRICESTGDDAPDRRKIGKGIYGVLFPLCKYFKSGRLRCERKRVFGKTRRVMIPMRDSDVSLIQWNEVDNRSHALLDRLHRIPGHPAYLLGVRSAAIRPIGPGQPNDLPGWTGLQVRAHLRRP